jgi:hypothetical protein
MAINWTGSPHDTPGVANLPRDYDRIAHSARIAREGVLHADLARLAEGVALYHQTQLDEGMVPLPRISDSIACKYCGGGYGGYALYLFDDPAHRGAAVAATPQLRAVEPLCRI